MIGRRLHVHSDGLRARNHLPTSSAICTVKRKPFRPGETNADVHEPSKTDLRPGDRSRPKRRASRTRGDDRRSGRFVQCLGGRRYSALPRNWFAPCSPDRPTTGSLCRTSGGCDRRRPRRGKPIRGKGGTVHKALCPFCLPLMQGHAKAPGSGRGRAQADFPGTIPVRSHPSRAQRPAPIYLRCAPWRASHDLIPSPRSSLAARVFHILEAPPQAGRLMKSARRSFR